MNGTVSSNISLKKNVIVLTLVGLALMIVQSVNAATVNPEVKYDGDA